MEKVMFYATMLQLQFKEIPTRKVYVKGVVAQCVINLIKCYIFSVFDIYVFISVWDSFIYGASCTCRRQRIRYYF
jgi:hypothetical protein